MSNTDFFDDDLIQHRDNTQNLSMGPGGESAPGADSSEGYVGQPVSELNLSRMARHKEEVQDQVVKAGEELERLRQRQEALEREKHSLEDLRRKQDDYETGRRDMIEHLGQSLMTLEREEIRTGQTCDLLASTRRRFKEMLEEVEAINEEDWDPDHVGDELNKALAVLEDARIEFNKTRAKVQASVSTENVAVDSQPVVFETTPSSGGEKPFGYWFMVGFAASLPLMLMILLLTGIYFFLRSQAMI